MKKIFSLILIVCFVFAMPISVLAETIGKVNIEEWRYEELKEDAVLHTFSLKPIRDVKAGEVVKVYLDLWVWVSPGNLYSYVVCEDGQAGYLSGHERIVAAYPYAEDYVNKTLRLENPVQLLDYNGDNLITARNKVVIKGSWKYDANYVVVEYNGTTGIIQKNVLNNSAFVALISKPKIKATLVPCIKSKKR